MSAKRAFFGVFQKFMVVCCAIFFGFANAFSANLPAGYQQVEYIESNGTQYFDTGIVGKSGVSVEAKFMLTTEANGSLFGNRQSDNTRFWPAMWFKNSGSSIWQWDVTVNVDTLAGTVNKNTLYTTYFVSNSSGWTLDVNGERVSSGTQVGTNTNNMWMFGTNDGRTNTLQYPFIGKAYSAKIWQNATLVRNFVPVKDSSGKFGMYDLVSSRFYPSASSTQFTGGNPVIGSACNDGSGVLAVQQNLYDTAIVRHKGCTAADGTYPYSDTATNFLNVFFNVEPNTSYTYTTTTAGTRDGIYEYNNVFNPDDYNTGSRISTDRTIQSGITEGKYASGTFTTSANAKMIMYYGSNDWPTTPKGLTIYPTNRPIGTVYCDTTYPVNAIKIATMAYNTAQFNPVVTDLNTTIATIRDVVTNTINQTKAIADLQAKKQTRPDEQCPAGKKCLLVETEENGVIVPHWYEIIEKYSRLPEGYTELEYVKFNGGQYVDTGIVLTQTTNIENVISMQSDCGSNFCTWTGFMPSSSVTTPRYGINELSGAYMLGINTTASGLSRDANKHILKFVTSGSNQILYDVVDESNIRTLVSTSLSGSFYGNTLSLYVGARHSSSTPVNFVSGKIYYTYLKQNGNLLYDYIPAKRDSDGAIGFYDNVSQSFKAPSGTLTAGPEI